jgi:beta-lactamase class A
MAIGLAASMFAKSAPATDSQSDAVLQKQVETIAAAHHGKVALFAKNLSTGATVGINPDTVIQTASTIKLAALIEAFYQIKAGKKNLADKVTLRKEDQVGGSGILQFLRAPIELTLEDVLTFMIVESDNTATNLAIDQLGLKNINQRIAAMGFTNTYFYKKVYKPAEEPMPADQKTYGLGKTTAREIGEMLVSIDHCDLGDAPLCGKMLEILKKQQYREAVPRYLETSDTSEEPSAIANKTGALNALRADVALVYTKSATILVSAFTYDNSDERWTPDNEGYLTIAKLSKTIVEAWAPQRPAQTKSEKR